MLTIYQATKLTGDSGLSRMTGIEYLREKQRYPKYTWVGNRISASDMFRLYTLKVKTKTPITRIVSQAVKEFLDKHEKEHNGEQEI